MTRRSSTAPAVLVAPPDEAPELLLPPEAVAAIRAMPPIPADDLDELAARLDSLRAGRVGRLWGSL